MNITICKVAPGSALCAELLTFVENSTWAEVKEHTAQVIRENRFREWEAMFVALDGDQIVGHASIAKTDYYPLPNLYPWISTIFVDEKYRGRGICGLMIDFINRYAKEAGFRQTYIPSAFFGLYEKYGYQYVKDIVNYGGGIDHLFVKNTAADET